MVRDVKVQEQLYQQHLAARHPVQLMTVPIRFFLR